MKKFLILLTVAAVVSCVFGTITSVNDLSTQERHWVDWIKKWTYPNSKTMNGAAWDNSAWPGLSPEPTITPRAYAVAIATWWSLSEKIFQYQYSDFSSVDVPESDGYLFNYNLCTELVNGVTASNIMKAPNYVCKSDSPLCGSCWQNGLFGMEMKYTTALQVATAAEAIYNKTYLNVIQSTMALAGHSTSSSVYKDVMTCFPNGESVDVRSVTMTCANLIKIWLVRNHLVGASVAVYNNAACLKSGTFDWSYCAENKQLSDGFNDVKNTIEVLAKYFMT